MKNDTVIKQTIEYTAGLFRGQRTELYLSVYKRPRIESYTGSPYMVVSEEIIGTVPSGAGFGVDKVTGRLIY